MATANPTRQIPTAVLHKLRRLRGQLTRWILVQGIGRWLLVLMAILVADMVLDRFFKMDFAQRLVMLGVMATAVLVYFFYRVLKPLGSRPNDEALIYEVEHKNPELNESLISSVQLARERNLDQLGMSRQLAEATMEQGFSRAEAIDFGKSLDLGQASRNWLIMLVGLLGLTSLAIGVNRTDFLQTWFNRNILLQDDQWPQATYLEIAGVEDGRLILPRGADHRQIVSITQDSTITNVPVTIEIDNPGGRTVHTMKPTGRLDGRERVFLFHNVSSKFRFRASGGDETTDWIEVDLVEPPNVIERELTARLPAYTGVSELPLVGNGPHALLAGSRLEIAIETNKPLRQAQLQLGETTYPMQAQGDEQHFAVAIPGEGETLLGGDYEFELVDPSGLASTRASKFKLTIKEDDPAKVRANLLGITGLVSARAMLPTSFQAADEYGLQRIYFDATWKLSDDNVAGDSAADAQRAIEIARPPATGGIPTRELQDVAVLDLLPLELQPGTSFRFSVAAVDNRPDGTDIGRSQEFLLRVVSDDELRADLLRREIEQRKAFDQAYQVQMKLSADLEALAVRGPVDDVTKAAFFQKQDTALIELIGTQKSIGTSIDEIASRFEEFLVEVKNNRLDEAENAIAPERRIETRFDQKIIQPIRRLDQDLVALATRQMDNSRRFIQTPDELGGAVDQAIEIQQQILEEMKRILAAMNDSESFQELINDMLQVKSEAEKIRSEIQKQLKPGDIFEDKDDLDDIFDK